MKKLLAISLLTIFCNLSQAQFISKPWETFKSSGPDMKLAGWLAPRHSRDIKSSSWSIGCETVDRDYTKFSNYKNYVGELGAKSARFQGGWAKCEKVKGVYSFGWLDSCVYGLLEQSVKPWISLCYGNKNYGSDVVLGSKIWDSDEAMNGWLRWVEATVSRYKNDVNEWEVWNEPNGWEEESTGYPGDSKGYANLLMKTAEVIKKIQPGAIIIGFSIYQTAPKFTKEVFEILKSNNKLDIVNYLTYHPYSFNPDNSYPAVEKLRDQVKSYNPDIKLFQGENGAPAINHVYNALSNYPWTEFSQAKWVIRRMAGDISHNIRCNIFTIMDVKYPNVLNSKGLIRSNLLQEVLYRKPSFYAFQHMAGFFDDEVRVLGELKYKTNSKRTITVSGFTKSDNQVVLIWYNDKIPTDDFKWDNIDLTILNTHLIDPVYVEMISGKVYEFNKSGFRSKGENSVFKNLPVWDGVIMITERSNIKIQ
jgi:hypothetical protein